MTFSITPKSTYPKGAASAFPKYLEMRNAGAPLGDRNIRIVDITGSGLLATRGVGENSHVVTVRRAGNDPLFADVLLLMPGDTTNIDRSPHNRAVAVSGNPPNDPVVSTDHLVFGMPMIKVPGVSGNGISVQYGTGYVDGLTLDNRDFTIEYFLWIDSTPSGGAYEDPVITQNPTFPLFLGGFDQVDKWSAWIGFASVGSPGGWGAKIDTNVTIARGTLLFVQFIRSGSTFTLAINGAAIGSATFAGNIDSPNVPSGGSFVFATNQGFSTQHYVAQYRVTRGVRPIAIPTAPWPTF